MIELALDPHLNKTGDVWHICIEDLPGSNVLYGYRIDGSQDWGKGHQFDRSIVLVDPYAKLVEGRRYFGDISKKLSKFLGTYEFDSLPFDWGENYKLPNIAEKDLVIYEMNVRAFTMDESSGLDNNIRGSYLGVIEKIPHLLELGINAVELLPIFEFDELELQRRPNPRDHMINTWGYSTINFFAPMSRYASAGGGPVNASQEFKQMVKALHSASIEVILDVVYNHTNEADDPNPYTTSFRGIDNKVYYMLDDKGQLLNFSGCGSILYIKKYLALQTTMEGLVVAMSLIGATVITTCSGPISDWLGRRPMLIISSVLYFLGSLVMLWSPNVYVLCLARLLDGFGIGLAVTLVPVYISETAPSDIRGSLNTLPQLSGSGGMFLSYCMVFVMSLSASPSWRVMLGVLAIPSLFFFILTLFFLPESPRWLVSKGKMLEAKKALQRLRGQEDVSGGYEWIWMWHKSCILKDHEVFDTWP